MKCPFCGEISNKVVDSRLSKEKDTIKRRRECNACGRRFTTFEKVEDIMPMVVKKDGRRELFSRKKIIEGIKKACEKRPISMEQIEEFADELEAHFQDMGKKEIKSSEIGELVVSKLKEWDEVAYVRFASVYRQFKDIEEFMEELKGLLKSRIREEKSDQPQ